MLTTLILMNLIRNRLTLILKNPSLMSLIPMSRSLRNLSLRSRNLMNLTVNRA